MQEIPENRVFGLPADLTTKKEKVLRILGYLPVIGTVVGVAHSIFYSIYKHANDKMTGSECWYRVGRGLLESIPGVGFVSLLSVDALISARKKNLHASTKKEEKAPTEDQHDLKISQGKVSAEVMAIWEDANSLLKQNNFNGAIELFQQLAGLGVPAAQFALGVFYEEGRIVKQDFQEAAHLYRLAADQNFADAQFNLGLCYEQGIGVNQNYGEAAHLYKLAARQGIAQAQNNLGLCYEKGLGVEKNIEKAIEWYEKAARQNCAEAQRNLEILSKENKATKAQ